ncbi:alpha/beta hydrolase-fold protein [Parabacteroides sp. PF5-9]|uniref:carboxylesterase family protein n=1 Tax=Parabacteroides sp. PF5-9 TaxID=1742404 RepID=UPI0024739E30|nr:alpha/beta hydrolase-fold protein [Parabacteroides sp. PF5-9]MDH6356735.1 putative peptidase [Parabacteroides sp. PF5-9]
MKAIRHLLLLCVCLLVSAQAFAGDKTSFLKKQFTTANGYKLNYRVLYPENYDPGKKYPVLLFLHGAGERGSDNEAQLVHGGDMLASHINRSKYPMIIIAPQCPAEEFWVDYRRPSDGQARYYPVNPAITKPLAAVKELLDSFISKGKVDTQQIHVTGLSMGGMGTFDLLCRYPNFFATASPICGAVNVDRIGRYKGKTAIRIYHGAEDNVVDVKYSQEAYQALKKAGANVRYKEYPGVNHGSWTNAFAEPDYISWFFQQP